VFAIADGMGGYAAGEVASQLAVDVLSEAFKTNTFTGEPDATLPKRGDELVRAIQMANTAILTQARANEAQSGMGTTMVSCRFSPNKQRVYIAHVGDSRAYRFRGDEIKQLTTDHTLGAVGITGPAASKLSRAVGIQDIVDVDVTVDAPKVGDHYMLCSDGLSKMVPEPMIRDIVKNGEGDLNRTIERLVETANERGGRDNVTVILIGVREPAI
jgi:protein phosphatase